MPGSPEIVRKPETTRKVEAFFRENEGLIKLVSYGLAVYIDQLESANQPEEGQPIHDIADTLARLNTIKTCLSSGFEDHIMRELILRGNEVYINISPKAAIRPGQATRLDLRNGPVEDYRLLLRYNEGSSGYGIDPHSVLASSNFQVEIASRRQALVEGKYYQQMMEGFSVVIGRDGTCYGSGKKYTGEFTYRSDRQIDLEIEGKDKLVNSLISGVQGLGLL